MKDIQIQAIGLMSGTSLDGLDEYPPTPYWEDYQQVLDWITSRAVFTLY